MKKKIVINSCSRCPYLTKGVNDVEMRLGMYPYSSYITRKDVYMCSKIVKEIKNIKSEILNWCPLPDEHLEF